ARGTTRTLLANLGAPGTRFASVLARNVGLRFGVGVKVGIDRSNPTAGLTLNFHRAIAGPSRITIPDPPSPSPVAPVVLNAAVVDALFTAFISAGNTNLTTPFGTFPTLGFGTFPTFGADLGASVFGPVDPFAPPPNFFLPQPFGSVNPVTF